MPTKSKTDIVDTVKTFIDSISGRYKIHAVFFFGSRVYGNPGEESDIDIAIILDEDVDDAKDFDIFRRAQDFDLDMELVVFSVVEFNRNAIDLVVEVKEKGEKIA
ncbi:MAG: nucleotidyltransferase domain-containing protein [Spirochaetota bacterium]